MGIVRKPIKVKKWYRGKTPIIQIKILKLIVIYGQLSKTSATQLLKSDYKDVSKAMEALENNRLIVLSSSPPTTHNRKKGRPEKIYKLSDNGLRALLIKEVAAYLSPAEFWKIILISIKSDRNWFDESEFNCCYSSFERDRVGFSSENMHCALLHPDFIHKMMHTLISARESESITTGRYCIIRPSLHQTVLECLAINGPLTLRQLADKSKINEQELKGFLKKYCPNDDEEHFVLPEDITNKVNPHRIDIYFDYLVNIFSINRKLGNNKETTYALSLLGTILVLMFVRNYYVNMVNDGGYNEIDKNIIKADEHVKPERVRLFYNDISLQEYYDRIAYNYNKTLPLIFGKWRFLEGVFGSQFLYDTFDFLIYQQDFGQFALTSVQTGGKKEFYDNLVSATENSLPNLYAIQRSGKTVLENFGKKYADLKNDPKIIPMRQKLNSIEAILKIASITLFLHKRLLIKTSESIPLFFLGSMWTRPWNLTTEDVTSIENVLKYELSFFYYLSLDTIVYYARTFRSMNSLSDSIEERFRFGSPRHALRKILSEDKEIVQIFKGFMDSITGYQHLITQGMDDIYKEVIRLQRSVKKNEYVERKPVNKNKIKKPVLITDDEHEEYDLSNILYTEVE